MSDLFWILTIILVVGIIAIRAATQYTKPRVHCPQCGGDSITEVRKETLATRASHRHTGLQGRTDIETDYQVEYRCNDCSTGWKKEFTETR